MANSQPDAPVQSNEAQEDEPVQYTEAQLNVLISMAKQLQFQDDVDHWEQMLTKLQAQKAASA